jgi:cob(I)alamin adenosyltransferase
MGSGFTWESKDLAETAARVRAAWSLAQEKIASGVYDLVILDEMTYGFHHGWLNLDEVVGWLRANRPVGVHVIITGRDAPAELIELADLVTEMRKIKHPYDQGIRAQAGIEY